MKVEIHEIDGVFILVYTYEKRDIEYGLFLWSKIGKYRIRKDKPHSEYGEYHIHVYEGKIEILSINKSGEAHDKSHGKRIPNKVYKYLKKEYPSWNWPSNQVIPLIISTASEKASLKYVKYLVENKIRIGRFHGLGFFEFEENGIIKKVTKALIENDGGILEILEIDKIMFIE